MSRRRTWFPKHYADEVQRLRVPMGFLMAAAFFWLAAPGRWTMAAGIPVSLCGLLVRAWAAGHLAKNESLAESGPYASVRNPLYVGTLLTVMGLAIAAWQAWLVALFLFVFGLVYLPAIELEEQHLSKLFPDYEAYAARVPMLIPRRRPSGRIRGFRPALYWKNREYQGLGGWLAGVAYLAWRAGLLAWPA